MNLLPQLMSHYAQPMAEELRALSISESRERRAVEYCKQIYSPTGGNRMTKPQYASLVAGLVACAESAGYPEVSRASQLRFDIGASIFLHTNLHATANEMAKPGVWNFLSCVAVPDIVRWRFYQDNATTIDRYLAGQKNTFERLWRRARCYFDANNPLDPYWLVKEIGEDESVAIMERTTLSSIPPLVVTLLKSLIDVHRQLGPIARSELMREGMKRFLRYGSLVAFESLSEDQLTQFSANIFADSASQLRAD